VAHFILADVAAVLRIAVSEYNVIIELEYKILLRISHHSNLSKCLHNVLFLPTKSH